MKLAHLLAIGSAVMASGASFAYDWSGKTGVVTLSESAEVLDADLEVVTNLTGIVLEGVDTDLIFNNATVPATLKGHIKGDGRIVKRGMADLVFGEPALNSTEKISAGNRCMDYFTTGGIKLEAGTTYLALRA